MRLFIFLIIAVLLSESSIAQKLDIKIFDKTSSNTIKEIDKNLAEAKRIEKENKAFLKEQKKKYKAYRDSVANNRDSLSISQKDSIAYLEKLQEEHFMYTNELHQLEDIKNWDSLKQSSKTELLDYSKERLSGNYYYQKYASMNDQIMGYHKELKVYKDSLKATEDDKQKREYLLILKKEELKDKYGNDLEERAQQELVKGKAIDFPTSNPELEKILGYQDMLKSNPVNQSKAKGVDYFAGKENLLADAMSQSSELKKVYSKVVDSNDLSTATKRSSMKDDPIGKRFVFGGTFQIYIDQETSIDLSPELAYRITKKWSAGVGGTYRVNSDIEDLAKTIKSQQAYGYRVFSEYQLFKSFYGHVEFESLAANIKTVTDESSVEWNNSFLAGIERRFKLGSSAEAQISLLYNFNHKDNPLYNGPWNVRFGFNLNGGGKKE